MMRDKIARFMALDALDKTSEAELADVRVGADGTVYPNAGTAVRTQVGELKQDLVDISEKTYNLIIGHMPVFTINANGIIRTSLDGTDLHVAIVESGKTYTIKTDEELAIYGIFSTYPKDGDVSLVGRIISSEKTITPTESGYIAFRSLSNYNEAQIIEGEIDKSYLNPIIANDGYARNKILNIEKIVSNNTNTKFLASDISVFENIGFCGDSYMAGMIVVSENPTKTAENQNLCWGKILERTHGINAFIYAKGGVKASDFITDERCLPKLLSETAKQLYVISLGHNDAYNRTSVDSFKTSYRSILDSIISYAPNAKIILCRQSKGYGDMNNGAELNDAISDIGLEYGIPVLNPEDDPYLSSDIYIQTQVHNHPTFMGYAGLAKAFDRLFSKATVDYWDYFKGYTGL